MKNKELLPCPFCGGEAFAVTGIVDEGIRQIMCRKCYAKTTVYRTKKEAITAWNTRTNKITVGNGEDYKVVQG